MSYLELDETRPTVVYGWKTLFSVQILITQGKSFSNVHLLGIVDTFNDKLFDNKHRMILSNYHVSTAKHNCQAKTQRDKPASVEVN